MDKGTLEKERSMVIAKSNEMIKNVRHSLSTMEQKIVLFLFSKIKPTDTELTEYSFELKQFCDVCGIDYDNGGNNKYIKTVIKKLADNSFWVLKEDDSEELCRWIQKATLHRGKARCTIKLHEDVLRYAIGLIEDGKFTQFMMIYTLPMKGQCSRHLYEIFKSREYEIKKYHRQYFVYEVDHLQHILMTKYKKYNDFKRKVIDYAMEEINEYSDLSVSYEEIPIKTGKRGKPAIGSLKFHIQSRDILDTYITQKANNSVLNNALK